MATRKEAHTSFHLNDIEQLKLSRRLIDARARPFMKYSFRFPPFIQHIMILFILVRSAAAIFHKKFPF